MSDLILGTPSARMIGITQPVPGIKEFSSAEDMLVYIAKVSNPKAQADFSKSYRLLKYLIKNCHWSPFEMVNVVMEVITTRDIGRQLLRHKTYRFQEFSQRYEDPTCSLGFMVREARLQDRKNRQNSIDFDDEVIKSEFLARQLAHISSAQENYEWSVSRGIALEQARVFLPEGNTLSKIYVNGDLRTWIHYAGDNLGLRRGNGTQKEHRELADMCWKAISEHFPRITQALEEIGE